MSFSVIKYNNLDNLLQLEFDLSDHSRWKIICPNPTLADAFREKVKTHSQEFTLETTTVSKYLSDLLTEHFPDKKVYRKSELFLMMATVWKMRFSQEDPSLFHQAFEILTDLRSFTLNKQLIENLLELYHPVVAEAVKTFWLIMEDQEVLDEHQAYNDLNEVLLSPYTEQENEESIEGTIFLGFTHLSANQIEIFKSLGKTRKVYLPIPSEIMNSCQWTDWTKWVETQADAQVEIGGSQGEIVSQVKTYSFPKGRGNKVLKSLLSENERDVLFFKKKVSFKEVMEVPTRNHFFRADTDLYDHLLTELKSDLESKFLNRNVAEVSSEDLKVEIKSMFSDFKGSSFKDFKKFKVLQLVFKELERYIEYSEVNETFGLFDFDILWEVINLNLPRNFNLPLLKTPKRSLLGLNDIHKVSPKQELLFFVDGDHDLKSGGGANYSTEVQEILITLGPMRRSSLDVEFYQFYLKELMGKGNVTLVLESGLMDHDQSLNLLFEDMDLQYESLEYSEKEAREFSFPLNLEGYEPPQRVSPSRLQTYIECPRKYYFSNIEKIGQEPKKKESIDPRLLGQAEHEIVDVYLKSEVEFSRDKLDKIIEEVSLRTFPKEVLEQAILKEEITVELLNYSQFLIGELLKLKKADPEMALTFEVEFKTEDARGSIDLIVTSPKLGTMIFDMKRSASSIPEKSKVNSFSSIQVLYYLKNYEKEWSDYTAFGYLNLSDLSQSLIYCTNEDVYQIFKETGFLGLEDIHDKVTRGRKGIPFDEFYSEFEEFVSEKLSAFKLDRDFIATPMDTGACMFCPGKLICDKGQM
ncbi:MAG: PD-(D/E)XK nuclease family protein [Halobacteriovoraceae bacterium]|nr:PD-(D/E)XK nuclease family protein [Halobacteriovoraceae bacterium]